MNSPLPTHGIPKTALDARGRLNELVEQGRKRASPVVDRIMARVPDDALVRADRMSFEAPGDYVTATVGEVTWRLHRNALDQLSGRVGLPAGYVRYLLDCDDPNGDDAWRRELLETVLIEHARHSGSRFLIRSSEGEARAVLSDKYRRLDSRPLLDAFVGACMEVGAVPFEGMSSDLSASVRVVLPEVFEPVPGEALVLGLSWSNSDYGTRAYSLSTFVLRLVCLNGMVGSNRLKQVHLGGRLPEHLEFSEKTYELDTSTMVSATRDVVTASLGRTAVEEQLATVRAAHSAEVDWSSAWRRLSRELNKQEQKSVKDAFDGPDVLHLPVGRTPWRLSNCLSWLANSSADPERKLDLQRLAGAVLPEAV